MSISDDEEDKKLGAIASGVATSSSEDEGDKELISTPTLAERHNALKAAAASCSTVGARAQSTASTTSARGGATASCTQLFSTSDPRCALAPARSQRQQISLLEALPYSSKLAERLWSSSPFLFTLVGRQPNNCGPVYCSGVFQAAS